MNKGFTLVELLAILVILTALFLLTSTLVGPVLDNSKESLSEVQIKKIEEAAKTYYIKEELTVQYSDLNETNTCINISDLINNGYIDKDEIVEPESGEKITGSVKITYRANNYSYEYQDNTCTKKDKGIICEAVNETTVGTVPEGNFIPGDKYECEVKPGTTYNFYVLSTEEDKVNLIMDRNIYYDEDTNTSGKTTEINKGLVAWYEGNEDNSYGPITAMTYLHNATKDWINVLNVIMDYEDENVQWNNETIQNFGYGKIETVQNSTTIVNDYSNITNESFIDLKARLPKYGELEDVGCTQLVGEEGNESCPFWLVNYLFSGKKEGQEEPYKGESGKESISYIYGYWTLASVANNLQYAWDINYMGHLDEDGTIVNKNDLIGVRPVISMYKFQLD